MTEQKDLVELLRKKQEELRELRDARTQASCSRHDYSRPDDMARMMHVEELEEEIAELKKRLAAAR
jgi:ribosomal protein L29